MKNYRYPLEETNKRYKADEDGSKPWKNSSEKSAYYYVNIEQGEIHKIRKLASFFAGLLKMNWK